MKYIKFNPNTSIKEIQTNFQTHYPNLNIKFYTTWHEPKEGSPKSEEIAENLLFSEMNPHIKEDIININPDITAANIESQFEERDLHVQVFRKKNNVWLQSTTCDHWSLEKLNSEE